MGIAFGLWVDFGSRGRLHATAFRPPARVANPTPRQNEPQGEVPDPAGHRCFVFTLSFSRFHVFTRRILGHVPRLTPPAIDQQSSHRSSRGGPPGFAPARCLRTHAIRGMTTKATREALQTEASTWRWGLLARASTSGHANLIRDERNTDPSHDGKRAVKPEL